MKDLPRKGKTAVLELEHKNTMTVYVNKKDKLGTEVKLVDFSLALEALAVFPVLNNVDQYALVEQQLRGFKLFLFDSSGKRISGECKVIFYIKARNDS